VQPLDPPLGLGGYSFVPANTPDWPRHLAALRHFFECIREANLTLRPSKCEIGVTTVSFLGHTLTEGEMKPGPETVEKILKVPPPRTMKQLRAFLGRFNACSRRVSYRPVVRSQ